MKRILAVLLAVTFLFAFTACAGQPATEASTSTGTVASEAPAAAEAPAGTESMDILGSTFSMVPHDSNELYIHVSCYGSLDYFYDHKVGTEIAGKILDVKTDYVGPDGYDMDAMVTAFEQAIARKPAGIIVFGADDTLAAVINEASDAGIPVVCVDGDVPSSKRVAFVGTGQFNAGVMGGNYLVQMLGGKGKIAFLTVPGQAHLEARISGYKSIIDQYPDIEVVQTGDTQTDPTVAAQTAAAILQKYPDLSAFVCVEASGGAGALTAVKEAGLQGQVKILSMDRGADVLQAIKDGIISASIVQQTALMPIYAMEILYNLHHYGVPITTNNALTGLTGTPINIDTGCVMVDSNNVDYFIRGVN